MLENIFNVTTYIKYLKNFYIYPYDEETFEQRSASIERLDKKYLEQIIENTKIFCFNVLEKLKDENQVHRNLIFTSIHLSEKECAISNGCVGGYPSDILVLPAEYLDDCFVSEYLMKQFFEGFQINDDCDIEEIYNEQEQVGIEIIRKKLTFLGKIEDFDTLYEETKKELEQHVVRSIKQKKNSR